MYATHSFWFEALFWWYNVKQAKGPGVTSALTWNELKEHIMEKFCHKIEKDKIEREFIQLQAGTMTHRQYTTKFYEMARLLPEHVKPEAKRVKRYVQGLPPRIRELVRISAPKTYESAIALSAIAYEEDGKITSDNKMK
ncbi:uncharacterized protein LOC110901358 [Helianthus annuus]|uniref:uncharacterized protein LOC110901358 n=1 Tax=Helianthus annuus TaxID=4232 RepID=UPI000B8F156B|nr:uncharacterized protein LOC110901358 [Helianthus annuus]